MNKNEKQNMRIWNAFEEFFVCALIYVLMTWFVPEGQVWKQVWILVVLSKKRCEKWQVFGLK